MKFYRCNHCGNIITKLTDKHVPVICCGEEMKEYLPNLTEAAVEKHKPVITEIDGQAYAVVGSVLHPMTPEHYIEWMVVEYKDHEVVKQFAPTDEPKLALSNVEDIVDIHAYCNLHGLWKMDK